MSEVDATRVVGTLLVNASGVLSMLGGRPREDAWRRSGRVHLRGEAARFTQAVLGLISDAAPAALTRRLAAFLRDQPVVSCALDWHRHRAVRVVKETADVTWARFDPSGRLVGIEPHLDERVAIPYERFLRGLLSELVVDAHDQTRFLPELERPLALLDYAAARIDLVVSRAALPQDAREAARSWVWRVLTSTVLTEERLEGPHDPRRFVAPQFLDTRGFGAGVFDVRARQVDGETVDLWVRCSPLAVDGRPVHEMLEALRAAWGTTPVSLPTEAREVPARDTDGQVQAGTVMASVPVPPAPALVPAGFESLAPRPAWAHTRRCSGDAEPPHVYEALELVDMRPFLEARQSLGDVSPTAMLIWLLAHQPAFADRRFAVVADVPARDTEARTTGLIVLRPADWFPGAFSGAGFQAFLTAFEREAESTRRRESASWKALERAVSVPQAGAHLVAPLEREALGTVGVGAIRGGAVFVPPWHPAWFDGSIGLADFAHAADDGATRCAVAFKGGRRRVEAAREALLAAVQQPRRYIPVE